MRLLVTIPHYFDAGAGDRPPEGLHRLFAPARSVIDQARKLASLVDVNISGRIDVVVRTTGERHEIEHHGARFLGELRRRSATP